MLMGLERGIKVALKVLRRRPEIRSGRGCERGRGRVLKLHVQEIDGELEVGP